MESCKKVLRGVALNGGILGIGVLGMYLASRRHIPDYMKPVSYGISLIGFVITTVYHMGDLSQDTDEESAERRARKVGKEMLEALTPAIEKQLAQQAQARKDAKEMEMTLILEGWSEQSQKISEKLARYAAKKESIASKKVESEPTDFQRILMKLDVPGPIEPELEDFLKNEVPVEDERVPVEDERVPVEDEREPAKPKADKEAIPVTANTVELRGGKLSEKGVEVCRELYCHEVSNFLKAASVDVKPSSSNPEAPDGNQAGASSSVGNSGGANF